MEGNILLKCTNIYNIVHNVYYSCKHKGFLAQIREIDSLLYITCSNSINKVIFFKPDNLTNLNRVYFKVTINDLRVLKSNLL